MKKIIFALILIVNTVYAYDWSFADLEYCSNYNAESFDTDTDFVIKCVDSDESIVYLEDYLLENEAN
jgi:hypothetical protein